jgi:hypothetical protein
MPPTLIQQPHWHLSTQASSSTLAPMIPFISPLPYIQPHITLAPLPGYAPPNHSLYAHTTNCTKRSGQLSPSAQSAPPRNLVSGERDDASGSGDMPPATPGGVVQTKPRCIKRASSMVFGSISVFIHPDVLVEAKDLYIICCFSEGEFFPSV